MRRLLLLSLTTFCLHAYGQAPGGGTLLHFAPMLHGESLQLSDDESGPSVRIQTLRCYISAIRLMKGGREAWREINSYHLLDASETESMSLRLATPTDIQYDMLLLQLGIDSATSSSGAHGGDLDPSKGMYWAWQSGYINFKLEGFSPQSNARKHQFHFHLGGYQQPFAAKQQVTLAVRPAKEILVKMDLDAFLSGIDLSKQNNIMIPGEEAFQLSKKAAIIFKTQ